LAANWYVLHSKPRKEMTLYKHLQDKGYDVFNPCIPVGTNDSKVMKWVPYFPGYLFVKIDLSQDRVSTFQWMPYAVGLVYFGEKPGYVPENLIRALERRVANGNPSSPAVSDDVVSQDELLDHTYYDEICAAIMNEKLMGSKRVSALLGLLKGLNV
jgi:transcription antitermination factor NusG